VLEQRATSFWLPGYVKNLKLRYWLMRFAAVNFFISPAGRTDSAFNISDKPETEAFLFFSRPLTYKAIDTDFRQLPVFFGDGYGAQVFPLIYY